MGLDSGYAHTDVGMIPTNWGVKQLGELTTLMTNGFVGVATSHYVDNENGVLYIQGYNVEENSFNFNGIKYVSENFHKTHLKSSLREGDLLTVQTGDVGLTTIVTDNLVGSNCHALIISRFDRKKTVPKFISYYLNSPQGRSRLKLIEIGTTMKHLNVSDMLRFNIPLPENKKEQEAIAEALSDADALIESLEKLIEKKRQIKQGAMQELLTGKKRLPGFSGEWATVSLGQVADIYQPQTISANQFTDNGYPVYGANGVVGLYHTTNHQSWQVTVTCRGSTCGTVNKTVDMCWITGNAMVINCDSNLKIEKSFLYYQLSNQNLNDCITGTGQPQIVRTPLANFLIKLPLDKIEQQQIAFILMDFDLELSELETKLTKARQIKQGMMQVLLTGRIRLV